MKICPNCQAENADTAKFCESCGQPLGEVASVADTNTATDETMATPEVETTAQTTETTGATTSEETSTTSTAAATAAPAPATVNHKGANNKALLIAIVALVVILFAGFKWGESHYSQEKQLNSFISAIKNDDAGAVKKFIITDDNSLKVTKASVEPFIAYFKKNKSELNELKQTLKYGGTYFGVDFTKHGKHLFLFDAYKAEVASAYAEVYTNQKDTKITFAKEEVAKADSDDFDQSVGPFLPGLYKIAAQGKTAEGEALDLSFEETLTTDSDNYFDLSFMLMTIPIQSNIADATVLVNGKEAGTLTDGAMTLGPLLYEEGLTIQLTAKLADGQEEKTDEYEVYEGEFSQELDEDYPLELDFDALTTDDLYYSLSSFYNDVATNGDSYYDYDSTAFAKEYFTEGADSEAFKTIDALIQESRKQSTANGLYSLYFEPTVNSCTLIGEDEYQVDYDLDVEISDYGQADDQTTKYYTYTGVKVIATYDEDTYDVSMQFEDFGDGGVEATE